MFSEKDDTPYIRCQGCHRSFNIKYLKRHLNSDENCARMYTIIDRKQLDEILSDKLLNLAARLRKFRANKKFQIIHDDEAQGIVYITATSCKGCFKVLLEYDLLAHLEKHSICKAIYSNIEIEQLLAQFQTYKSCKIKVSTHVICKSCHVPFEMVYRPFMKNHFAMGTMNCSDKYSEQDLDFLDKHTELIKNYYDGYDAAARKFMAQDCSSKLNKKIFLESKNETYSLNFLQKYGLMHDDECAELHSLKFEVDKKTEERLKHFISGENCLLNALQIFKRNIQSFHMSTNFKLFCEEEKNVDYHDQGDISLDMKN